VHEVRVNQIGPELADLGSHAADERRTHVAAGRHGSHVTIVASSDHEPTRRHALAEDAAVILEATGAEPVVVDEHCSGHGEIAAAAARYQRRSPRQSLYDLADAIAAIAERDPGLIAAVAHETMHPEPTRRHAALERMRYPVLIEGLLTELAASGRLRHGRRAATHLHQLVDLTAGTLVRVGGELPIAQLRGELRANVDLFCEGALRDAGT